MRQRQSLKVLVTGGSGFVGRAVVSELMKREHHVVATTRNFSEKLPIGGNLSWVTWDALIESLPPVDWDHLDVVLHLAMPPKVFDFPEQARPIYEVLVAATFQLLEVARCKGVRRVLVASTGDVLGSRERPSGEDDLLYMPSSFYGAAKACSELLLRAHKSILSTAILRLYHPYGPGGDRFLINRLVRAVTEGQEIRITSEDGITLNPVWIDDLAVGMCLAVESAESGIFHFAGPEILTLRDLVHRIGLVSDREPIITVEPGECTQQHTGTFEITRRILGYDPKVTVADGLRRLLDSAS